MGEYGHGLLLPGIYDKELTCQVGENLRNKYQGGSDKVASCKVASRTDFLRKEEEEKHRIDFRLK